MSLLSYAADHADEIAEISAQMQADQQAEAEAEAQAQAQAELDAQQQSETESALEQLPKITEMLQHGYRPEIILRIALMTIAQLTHNAEWGAAATAALDGIYKDLEQQSLTADNDAIEADRLEDQAEKYRQQIRRKLETTIKNTNKLATEMQNLINKIDGNPQVDPKQIIPDPAKQQ